MAQTFNTSTAIVRQVLKHAGLYGMVQDVVLSRTEHTPTAPCAGSCSRPPQQASTAYLGTSLSGLFTIQHWVL